MGKPCSRDNRLVSRTAFDAYYAACHNPTGSNGIRRLTSPLQVSRMLRIIMRGQQEAAGYVPVTIVDKPAIDRDQRIPVSAIEAGYAIPRERRSLVMQHMQVVVEKQQAEERAVFNDGRALVVMIGITVLGIGAQAAE